ncbi:MAG TPA: hypothetical protein VGE95_19185, partial [Arthrobacter sp.]
MSSETPYHRYTFVFGPRESGGIVLGLGWGSIMSVFVALFLLTALASAGGVQLLVGLVLLIATVTAVWVPLANRPLAQWIPIIVVFALRRATGMAHYRGGPAAQTRAGPSTPSGGSSPKASKDRTRPDRRRT